MKDQKLQVNNPVRVFEILSFLDRIEIVFVFCLKRSIEITLKRSIEITLKRSIEITYIFYQNYYYF